MTNFFISMIELIKTWIMKIPDLSIDSGYLANMTAAMETIIDFMSAVNFIIPLPTILLIMGIVYGFKVIKFTIFGINWIIRRLVDAFP